MPENDDGYSTTTALVFVFNLIVGTGALALPGAVSKAGWLPAIILISLLALISYITATFLIETLAVANYVRRQRNVQVQNDDDSDEDQPLLSDGTMEIREKFEVLELASSLLSRPTRIVVVMCLVVYLFGDLSIYFAVIARTMAHTTCTRPANSSCNATISDSEPCWQSYSLTRQNVYVLYLAGVMLYITPLVFMNLQKTKWLQFITSSLRWGSFAIMVTWSVQKLVMNGPQGSPPVADVYALPTLFGTCVYSFMCHHSLPNLIDPIRDKVRFTRVLPLNYALVSLFYILLSLTAIWTFSQVEDLYTLNFWSDSCSDTRTSILFLDYFLALFPVFTLSTSLPIIAITLRNNLFEYFKLPMRIWVVPLSICFLPALLAGLIPDLQLLVGVVGSYAGVALQYVAPTLLVAAARSQCSALGPTSNPYKSPFASTAWIWLVYIWTGLSLILISFHYVSILI